MEDKIVDRPSWQDKAFPIAFTISTGFMLLYVFLGLMGVIPVSYTHLTLPTTPYV